MKKVMEMWKVRLSVASSIVLLEAKLMKDRETVQAEQKGKPSVMK